MLGYVNTKARNLFDEDAYTDELAREALDGLDGDTTGEGYEAPEVELREGGA